jgi:DNA invertase Pin-like site-specific DNA recombinase
MIAAIYARKSTDQSGIADEQKSVVRQIEHAREYATRKGWRVDEHNVYVDDGISGAEFSSRPGYMRLLNALKPRPSFDILIVSELSRLGREQLELGYGVKQLSQADVRIFSYLEDREILLDSPTDKFLMSAVSFAAEIEREKGRQRTFDVMLRKAKAGHVTGGRVFGYDNVRVPAGHVMRIINEEEAAVVRRIFDLCIKGLGKIAIAKLLNAEGAPAPRAQQGRPRAWAPSSVREVLYRDLHRGVVTWNKTKKRNGWGQVQPTNRPADDWISVAAPELRLVSDAVWQAAHARLDESRDCYLRVTKGRLWGRPLDGVARKYLLTGLARCGKCGGSLEVRGGDHRYYCCSSYWRRGRAVCDNKLEIPLITGERAVLAALERELLTPDFVETVVRTVLTRQPQTGPAADELRIQLTAQLADVRREMDNLIEGLARTGASSALTTAIRQREDRQRELQAALNALDQRGELAKAEVSRLAELSRERVLAWGDTLSRHVPQARQILQKVLRDRLTFTPEERDGQRGYRFTAEGSIFPLLVGMVPEFAACPLSQTVASQSIPSWNQITAFLESMRRLRESGTFAA